MSKPGENGSRHGAIAALDRILSFGWRLANGKTLLVGWLFLVLFPVFSLDPVGVMLSLGGFLSFLNSFFAWLLAGKFHLGQSIRGGRVNADGLVLFPVWAIGEHNVWCLPRCACI
jgi:hypothetical protein